MSGLQWAEIAVLFHFYLRRITFSKGHIEQKICPDVHNLTNYVTTFALNMNIICIFDQAYYN